ncbi:MAG: hypothetical protein KatS3mg052_1355 [Candidatus Roseilinea sp.]|nr:MAG: hypothetical protein KatS3mg052_1355 [Candidatus Roseilinea sp.]
MKFERSLTLSRRRFIRAASITLSIGVGGVLAACAPASREPSMRIVYPQPGVRVPEAKVPIQVEVRNFRLVRPGPPRPGEGHLHLFIDVPASAIADGQIIPLDQTDKYVHMGAPPFATRTLTLSPGVHTITAVMADGLHAKLPIPAPVSVTFFVQPPPGT